MYKYTFTKQQKLTLNTIQIVNNQNTEKESEEINVINSEEGEQQNGEEIAEVYIKTFSYYNVL